MSDTLAKQFCKNIFSFERRDTVNIEVGNKFIGSKFPILVQTMTNTHTSDIEQTVEQCLKVAKAGAELVRITVPTIEDARLLGEIHRLLREKSCDIPISADVHFNSAVADVAAELVEKVRINPGNYVDSQAILSGNKKNLEENELSSKFRKLINLCKKHKTALRIGTNHGSLSGRIMDLYGDTPEGMVASAMEFLKICNEENFKNVVVSMKASNARVMVHANRLLVKEMLAENMHFPLHLGVTEAGDGEDGRIKSAVGIGTLLADGLGDTIRVSLTESPENEIPVAYEIVKYFEGRENHATISPVPSTHYNPYEYVKGTSNAVGKIGGKNPPVVIVDLSHLNPIQEKDIKDFGYYQQKEIWKRIEGSPDYIYSGESLWNCDQFGLDVIDCNGNFISCNSNNISVKMLEWLKEHPDFILFAESTNVNKVADIRALFLRLYNAGVPNPVVIHLTYHETSLESLQIKAACDAGALFIDGFGDGIMITNKAIDPIQIVNLSYSILQASRLRFTKTEFIACPGCGRTLFGLQETLAKVKAAVSHLKGLKIAVMGCIVNGPGEMADADYGYVGAGKDKVSLYKGKVPIKKNIPEEKAIEELISLIKENNDWVESSEIKNE